MAYRLEIKQSARKELAALPLHIQKRVDAAILTLADRPRSPRAKKLADPDDLYRIRVGNYRIVYQIQDQVHLVLVVRIAHRKQVYRR